MAAAERHALDLGDLEFDAGAEGGVDVARWVDRVRALVREHGRLSIRRCPQMLAHTLYKVGMLRDGRIELIDVREEEPYG